MYKSYNFIQHTRMNMFFTGPHECIVGNTMRNNEPPSSARRTFDTASATARAESRKAREAEVKAEDGKRFSDGVEGVREDELVALRAHTDKTIPGSFDHLVGRRQVIVAGNRAKSGGFYCKVCDSVHKDSNKYLAHINGRAHLHRLGMSTRAKRATLQDVVQAFEIERRRLLELDEEDEEETKAKEENRELLDAGVPTEFGTTAR